MIEILLIVVVLFLVLPAVALVRATAARRAVEELAARVSALEGRVIRAAAPVPAAESPAPAADLLRRVHEESAAKSFRADAQPAVPPPLPDFTRGPAEGPLQEDADAGRGTGLQPVAGASGAGAFFPRSGSLGGRQDARPAFWTNAEEPPAPTAVPAPEEASGGAWEGLVGARLFAWAGGFALFLAAAYGLKYSIDHNLLPPAMRVLLGLLAGAGLAAGGLFMDRRGYRVTAQALAGAGVVVAYAAGYVGHALYRLAPLTPGVTLVLLAGVTAAGIALALRLNSPVVAVLGSVAGFITPFLLPQGLESPLARFTYVGLLSSGLLAVVLRRGWGWLAPLAAAGTAVTLVADLSKLGDAQRTGVALGFLALFGGAAWWHARREDEADESPVMTAAMGLTMALGLTLLLTYVVAWSLIFRPQNTGNTVGLLLLAGTLHGVTQRWPGRVPRLPLLVLVPAGALALLLGAWVWAALPAVHLAWLPTAVVVLLLTGRGLFPLDRDAAADDSPATTRVTALAGTTLAAALVLLQGVLNHNLDAASWAFLGATLLAAWLLAGARRLRLAVLAPAAVLIVGAITNVWALTATDPAAYAELLPGSRLFTEPLGRDVSWSPAAMLAWLAGFAAVFTLLPTALRRVDDGRPAWWIAAAVAGPLHLLPLLGVVRQAWPVVPAALVPLVLAVPTGFVAWRAARSLAPENPHRLTALAWLWGAVLLLLTVALPLQLDRQWLTIGFAVEGAALLGLFRRLPHPGLARVGVALLVGAFFRLMLSPDLFTWGLPDGAPVFNALLYPFAVVIAALFAGARLSDEAAVPHSRRLLLALGTIALFALVNLQIAHFFTPPGNVRLDLSFTGNLARDMSYTLAWSVFALALVVVGLVRDLRAVRLAGAALFGAALLKLFFHDLARLDNLYRIGALLGVAIVALAASTLYQRFLKPDGSK
ncbi:MAG: DUF2339 domain-containing protein [Limisphaerales bacterium]